MKTKYLWSTMLNMLNRLGFVHCFPVFPIFKKLECAYEYDICWDISTRDEESRQCSTRSAKMNELTYQNRHVIVQNDLLPHKPFQYCELEGGSMFNRLLSNNIYLPSSIISMLLKIFYRISLDTFYLLVGEILTQLIQPQGKNLILCICK